MLGKPYGGILPIMILKGERLVECYGDEHMLKKCKRTTGGLGPCPRKSFASRTSGNTLL